MLPFFSLLRVGPRQDQVHRGDPGQEEGRARQAARGHAGGPGGPGRRREGARPHPDAGEEEQEEGRNDPASRGGWQGSQPTGRGTAAECQGGGTAIEAGQTGKSCHSSINKNYAIKSEGRS